MVYVFLDLLLGRYNCAKFDYWRTYVTWRPFCDQPASPSWIRLRLLLWIILCIEEYKGISASTSCDSIACLLHNNSWSMSWLGWCWSCSCHCLFQFNFCWVRHMRMLSSYLHCIICNMIYTSALFSRYISKIPCHYIPPCLSGKCGFCKFCEVHSFPKLTRYLLTNINTWFWNLI